MGVIEDAEKYHEEILEAGCFYPASSYYGVEVFKINRNTHEKNINLKTYYFTQYTYKGNKELFETDVHMQKKKVGICLHHTAGYLSGDLRYLTGGNPDGEEDGDLQYTSVPFLVSPSGRIYQLSDPDIELSWHLGSTLYSTDVYNNKVIGIELTNRGYFDDIPDPPDNITTLPQPFRGKIKFEQFTEEQYTALRKLIKAICQHYPQIKQKLLPLNERYEYFGEGGLNNPTKILNWHGISSHVNWKSAGKWDIGPAFDWDRLIPVHFPLETKSTSIPTLDWYANTELKKQGGYFPVGSNHTLHSGVHIFSNQNEAAVKCMADGYVVAFRFFSSEQHQPQSRILESIGLKHSKNTGFVLVRHDIKKPVSMQGQTVYEDRIIYTLYMDLEITSNEKMIQLPWIKELLKNIQEENIQISDDVFNTHAFTSNGKVVTFSKPLLCVTGGETIGYTVNGEDGENYLHWEVFTPEQNLFSDIMIDRGIMPEIISTETEDGIFDLNELNGLFPGEFQSLAPFLIVDKIGKGFEHFIHDHYAESDKKYIGKLEALKGLEKFQNFKQIHYSANEGNYVEIDQLSRRPKGVETIFKPYSKTGELLSHLSGRKIIISAEDDVLSNIFTVRLNLTDLENNRYNLEITLQALQRIDRILLIPPVNITPLRMENNNLTVSINHASLFSDFVTKENMLRNAIFSSISPWTEKYWRDTVENLKRRICINPLYSFNKDDFVEYILFDSDNEHPVYDPIFSGSTALINPTNKMTYMHPVTFIWTHLLNENNPIQFVSVPMT